MLDPEQERLLRQVEWLSIGETLGWRRIYAEVVWRAPEGPTFTGPLILNLRGRADWRAQIEPDADPPEDAIEPARRLYRELGGRDHLIAERQQRHVSPRPPELDELAGALRACLPEVVDRRGYQPAIDLALHSLSVEALTWLRSRVCAQEQRLVEEPPLQPPPPARRPPERRRSTRLGRECDEIIGKIRDAMDAILADPNQTLSKGSVCAALGIREVETLTGYETRCPDFNYEHEVQAAMRRAS